MIFFSLFCIAAASAALASAASRDMRGLSRLLNGTLAGRATFPSEGIHGVNLGSWLVFGAWRVILKSPRPYICSLFRTLYGHRRMARYGT